MHPRLEKRSHSRQLRRTRGGGRNARGNVTAHGILGLTGFMRAGTFTGTLLLAATQARVPEGCRRRTRPVLWPSEHPVFARIAAPRRRLVYFDTDRPEDSTIHQPDDARDGRPADMLEIDAIDRAIERGHRPLVCAQPAVVEVDDVARVIDGQERQTAGRVTETAATPDRAGVFGKVGWQAAGCDFGCDVEGGPECKPEDCAREDNRDRAPARQPQDPPVRPSGGVGLANGNQPPGTLR